MKTFQYITRNYTPSINLEVLGNTYNTLEQGHKEAIATASKLEEAIGKLEMDASEDSFKQQLTNEIKTTIDNNTIYGNSYAALDDLILQSGRLSNDGRVIGRVRNHAAKKEYDAKVDAMNIPEGIKQMYKEENPYYYKEGKIDERTGRILPGDKWEAKSNPVNTIPESEIQKYALSIAAKDAGGGEMISFLDENGKETYNPSKSVDGAFYRKTGSKYERLSESKIREAYKVAIDSIPGAKDSLKQDYKYAIYQHDKMVKDLRDKGENTNPIIPGITDSDGNVYSESQWLNNKMHRFANISAYNHTYSSVDFGTALQNRRAASNSRSDAGIGGNNIAGINSGNRRLGNIISGTEEVETNTFANVQLSRNTANRNTFNIINRVAGNRFKGFNDVSKLIKHLIDKEGVSGPGTAATYLIKKYGTNMSPKDKSLLVNSITGYWQANKQYKSMLNAAGNQGDALRFSANIANKQFTNDNKYGKAVTNYLNSIYAKNDKIEGEIGEDVMTNLLANYNTDLNGLKKLGLNVVILDNGNYNISIDADHRNLLPEFAHNIFKALDDTPTSFGRFMKNTFTPGVSKSNIAFNMAPTTAITVHTSAGAINRSQSPYSTIKKLATIYENGLSAASNVEKKVGTAKGTRSFSTASYGSFGSAYASAHPEITATTGETLKAFMDRQDENVDRMFAQGSFSAGKIQYLDAADRAHIDISKNQDAKNLLQSMYADDTNRKKIARSIKIPTGTEAGGTQGYKIVFDVPKGMGNSSFKEGEHVSLLVSGVSEEEINFNPAINPNVLAENAVMTSNATGGNVDVMGYNDNFGFTDLSPTKKGKFKSSFMGHNKELSEDAANEYTTAMFALQQLKNNIYAGMYNSHDENSMNLLANKINVISKSIASSTGEDINSVQNSVVNYINNDE